MKIAKFFLYSVTGGSGIYVGQKIYQDGRLDSNNFGAVRFGRAALSVGLIGVDYKRSLFSSSSPKYGTPEYEKAKTEVNQRSADRLLDLCNKNGGVFVKVGQHIGALDYLLPEEYVSTMKVLHARAPRMDLEDIYAVIKEDIGKDPNELFEEFEDELADLTSKNVMKSPTILTPPQCTPRSTSPISKSPASRSPARSPVRSPTSSKNSHSSGHAPQKQFLQGMCLNSAQYFHNFFKLFPSLILKSCNFLKPFQLFEKENGFLSPT